MALTSEQIKEIKDQLRQDNTIENSDHAMWIGYSLAKAQLALYGTLDEL